MRLGDERTFRVIPQPPHLGAELCGRKHVRRQEQMIIGDYQRFQRIYHLVVVSKFETLQASLRAVEMPMDELVTILHRIEWDGETRIFRIAEGKLVFTNDGRARVGLWAQAVNALGIAV